MFFGTTPQIVSQYLFNEFKKHNGKRIYVLFAGNFVVEQIASMACPNAQIYSTDISIYSRAIGFGANNIDFKLKIKQSIKKDFEYVARLTSPLEKAAQVIFFNEVSVLLSKKEKGIDYYVQLYQDAINNQKNYIEKIIDKLKKFKSSTKFVFYGIDACEVIKEVKNNDIVFYDPPVLNDNSDYENQYKDLKKCIEFDEVPYVNLDDKLKQEHLQLLKNKAIVYYRTNNPIISPKGYEEVYRYMYKWNGNYCLYSNKANEMFVGSFQPLKEIVKNIPIITEKDTINRKSKVSVIPQQAAVGNHYRLLWVKKAQMTDSGQCYIILIDGKLIGVAQISDSMKFGSELAVINSDPAAPTSKYKKLSKLVLNIICTKELLKDVNNRFMWEHLGFTTRVFSNNPTSMKYRNLFKLAKRELDNESDYKYKLIYQNRDKIFNTYKEGLINWIDKYSKDEKYS